MGRRLILTIFVTLMLGLTAGQAFGAGYDRAVYYDGDYAQGWIGNPDEIRDELEAAGYTVLDAAALRTWMQGHITDGGLSVVVFAQDIVPDTVASTNSEDCLLRQYLNAGGKIVWTSDIPFYYVGADDGSTTNWGNGGSSGILGFDASPNTGWDTGDTVTITEDGVAWGLTTTWSSNRPAPVDTWENFTALAMDDAGNAAAWAAHYVEGDTFRGFVRTSDFSGNTVSIADLMALAEYCLLFDTATGPMPEDGATDVVRDVVVSWTSGENAATHDVYFGTSFENVNLASRDNPLDVLVSQGQSENTYDPEGRLALGQTYYWRVDEVNAAPDYTIFKGDVWSFTAEPVAYAIENITATSNVASGADAGPEKTIDGSGLDENDCHSIDSPDMWLVQPAEGETVYIEYAFDKVYKLHEMMVWNYNVQFEMVLGFGLKDVTLEYSEDGIEWSVFGDVEFAKATSSSGYVANTIVDFQGIQAKYVRFTIHSGWGTMSPPQYGLSEVRFLYIPVQAREPEPADGDTDVTTDVVLAWRSGREAAEHEVYFGTDRAAVVDGTALVDAVTDNVYEPAAVEFGSTYYWKINEVNEAEAISAWEGDLWMFSTQEFATIEGFESFNDEDNLIYETWVDGWENGTGSFVGYFEAPFAEQTIVLDGLQSMPLEYNNAAAPYYSETYCDFDGADWTINGADTLLVNFQGRAGIFTERADGSVLMGAGGADIWGASDEFRFAYKQLSGDGSITACVDSLVNSNGWAKAGVMIRQNLNATAINAALFVTPENGITFQNRLTAGADSSNVAESGLTAPYWVKLTRADNVFTAQYSADGTTWTDLGDPVEIDMSDSAYIGLALTSHDGSIMTNAEYSNISTTGTVTGDWQAEAIGVDQPGNGAAPLYVAIEDASGKIATVTYPDTEATQTTIWQAWEIPYSDFAGVNMARVQTMYIGLGDRNNPTAGGNGLVFIDSIGIGHPGLLTESGTD